jgi:hypothetical protein
MQHQQKITDRAAYSPAEFARACGKHPTWAYRLLYAGKLKAVTKVGRLLIPATEMDRIMAFAEPYNPKPRNKKEVASDATSS